MKTIKEQLIELENLRSMKAEAYKTYYEALEHAKLLESRIFDELDQIRQSALLLDWHTVKFCVHNSYDYMQWYRVMVSPTYLNKFYSLLGGVSEIFVSKNPLEYDYSEGEYIILEPYNQLLKVRLDE